MKKTITINIAGLVFNIEENAYSMLKEYLEKIGNKFNNLEERQEITEDIEARIAELFTEKLNRNKEVVNENDVENVISIMGSPESFEGDDLDYEEKETNTESKSSTTNQKKKLFRDPDNKVAAGICAGISTYFDWNISIIRTVFALLILFGGTGFWLYIIAWIIIPEAKSTSEKLAMKGKNATVENIENYITKFRTEVKNLDTKNMSDSFKKQSSRFNDFLVGTSKRVNETLKPKENGIKILSSISSVIGFIIISIGLIILTNIITCLFITDCLLSNVLFFETNNRMFDIRLLSLEFFNISFIVFNITLGLGLTITGLRMIFFKNKDFIKRMNPIGSIVRFLVIFSFISLMVFYTMEKAPFSSSTYSHKEEMNYKNIVINKLSYTDNYSLPIGKVDFKIETMDYPIPYLRITTEAKGFKSYDFMENNKEYIITDSILEISPYTYSLNNTSKNLRIILYIPKNDSVTVINNFNDEKPK